VRVAVLLLGLPVAPVGAAQRPPDQVQIELATGSRLEREGRDQLRRILATYDLSPWVFTRRIRIQSRVIPHSHPVLTLNTRYLDSDTLQAATLLHEQLHWPLAERGAATDSAIADLRALYPAVPSGPPEGARDEYSTYLHLLVCTLELDAVSTVFGEAVARRVLADWRHYTWVYREVLARPEPIRAILRARGLDLRTGP
jgi:hypothetical protein